MNQIDQSFFVSVFNTKLDVEKKQKGTGEYL